MADQVRVRFAPSPTGYLHIGGLRTALFNYLFARRHGGKFILRIEDTDRTRFVPEALDDIKTGLRWLGLEWDEGPEKGGDFGPYVQSERSKIYTEHIQILLERGKAYRCFCSEQDLEQMRSEQQESGKQIMYDRRCRSLTPQESQKRASAGEPFVVRFAIPENGSTVIADRLRGNVSFDNNQLDDFILIKTDGMPTYHFANVVDDHLMKITHVLRGEEWISSTPKHRMLYDAFGWELPDFVHLPVILSPGGGKLSKRDGATRVYEFAAKGYLPEAMVNFLALLGWSLDGSTHMFSLAELEQKFDIDKVGLASPVFDLERLNDLNGKYIRQNSIDDLIPMFEKGLQGYSFTTSYLKEVIPLLRERISLLSEIPEQSGFFFGDTIDYGDNSILLPKKTSPEQVVEILKTAGDLLKNVEPFTEQNIEKRLRQMVGDMPYKPGQIFMSLRGCLTGTKKSPELFPTISVLGKERCLLRIENAINLLEREISG